MGRRAHKHTHTNGVMLFHFNLVCCIYPLMQWHFNVYHHRHRIAIASPSHRPIRPFHQLPVAIRHVFRFIWCDFGNDKLQLGNMQNDRIHIMSHFILAFMLMCATHVSVSVCALCMWCVEPFLVSLSLCAWVFLCTVLNPIPNRWRNYKIYAISCVNRCSTTCIFDHSFSYSSRLIECMRLSCIYMEIFVYRVYTTMV